MANRIQFGHEGEGCIVTDERAREHLLSIQRVFGHKWHPLIVYHLLADSPMRFSELQSSVDGISGKMLSSCLTELEELGVIEREVVDEKPVRVEYGLTRHGRSLEPIIDGMIRWQGARADEE